MISSTNRTATSTEEQNRTRVSLEAECEHLSVSVDHSSYLPDLMRLRSIDVEYTSSQVLLSFLRVTPLVGALSIGQVSQRDYDPLESTFTLK
jgi:hypothetical protein